VKCSHFVNRRFLVTASQNGCSSASGLKSSPNGGFLPPELLLLQTWVQNWLWVWVLCYDRRSVGQSILEWSTHLELMTRVLLLQTVACLLLWGALSVERRGLSFTIAASTRQRSNFRVRVPWDSWSYFTVSDWRLPFSSPSTTRRATVEIFYPTSTRGELTQLPHLSFITPGHRGVYRAIAWKRSLFTESMFNNGSICHIAPPLRLFVPSCTQAYRHFSLPRAVLVMSMIDLTSSVAHFSQLLLCNRSHCFLLKAARP
jgi:hypothetical protein